MHGNVWEWCQDKYDADHYIKSPMNDPYNLSSGSYHVLRGGSWSCDAGHCRSASRNCGGPDGRNVDLGFRCVLAGMDK